MSRYNKINTIKDEEAVSPVIGVILMVAITVILAAVIAVFVFGLTGDMDSSVQKDVKLQVSTNNTGFVEFIVFSGNDVSELVNITISNGSAGSDQSYQHNFKIGETLTSPFRKTEGAVVATGTFADGSRQVLART
ncbi:type IV pilin [Methanoplanus sp. FWC-SCC4]|uniref:Type IV pilin n=1 Tax=Methanochimaera problematica TaxID=2609417 RepID=A0AA97FG64_9EURY|nr:type IV pilin N-terminal domain-containing protein [Methanoplanus sp. FWC-SCC4]WOF16851.1 type IV pilin [Methanoplanus sp. FWC-SCC4]